jgi:hypothetical protein
MLRLLLWDWRAEQTEPQSGKPLAAKTGTGFTRLSLFRWSLSLGLSFLKRTRVPKITVTPMCCFVNEKILPIKKGVEIKPG